MTLLEEIKKEEGFESEPYICSNGYLTVGYGKRVDYLKVDEKTAEKWLIIDLEELDGKLDRSFTWYIDSPRDVKDVVKSMCYQMGMPRLMKFRKTNDLIKKRKWREASIEMLISRWHEQTPERAERLSQRLAALAD